MPVVLLCSTEDAQILLESLVGSLTSSIGLRVICCTDVLMNIEKTAEFGGEFRCEADISVRNDFAGNAVVWNHVMLRSRLPRAPIFFSLAPSILFPPTLTLTPLFSHCLSRPLTICSIFPAPHERLTFPGSTYPRLYLVRIPALVIVA